MQREKKKERQQAFTNGPILRGLIFVADQSGPTIMGQRIIKAQNILNFLYFITKIFNKQGIPRVVISDDIAISITEQPKLLI